MKTTHWFFHPIFVFIFSVLALGSSLILYIYWYIEVSSGLQSVVERLNLDVDQVLELQTWVVILTLSILVGIILLGIFTIFLYNQKTLQLYRLQHNFINNFTHELKTPVTSLKLFLETILKHDPKKADRDKYIHYMLEDVERLSDNVSRILNLARIESNSYEGVFQQLDVVEVTEDFVAKCRPTFPACSIAVANPEGIRFSGMLDRSLYEMMLMNLLSNAVKYNRSAVPAVGISFTVVNRRLNVHVADNGIGIEEKEKKKIFRKFYQVGRSDNMTAKGTGIGLHLVQSIAKLHSGKVSVESMGKDKGSVFTLTLPPEG